MYICYAPHAYHGGFIRLSKLTSFPAVWLSTAYDSLEFMWSFYAQIIPYESAHSHARISLGAPRFVGTMQRIQPNALRALFIWYIKSSVCYFPFKSEGSITLLLRFTAAWTSTRSFTTCSDCICLAAFSAVGYCHDLTAPVLWEQKSSSVPGLAKARASCSSPRRADVASHILHTLRITWVWKLFVL